MAQAKKEPTFEEALSRLDEIVTKLEDGEAPLQESLSYFEEGVKLVKLCNAQLDTAEKKIKVLSRNADGDIVEKDFQVTEE